MMENPGGDGGPESSIPGRGTGGGFGVLSGVGGRRAMVGVEVGFAVAASWVAIGLAAEPETPGALSKEEAFKLEGRAVSAN